MTPESLSHEEFQQLTGVSRETVERLDRYLQTLIRWQKAINLVSRSSLDEPWRRHMLDSAQLFPHARSRPCRVADLGSGAGFPGLVLAIMGIGDVHLIESDSRKCAFLREAARIVETPITIHESRIEKTPKIGADLVTSRALAPLDILLNYASLHLADGGQCLFLKGKNAEDELTQAVKQWNMAIELTPSVTDPNGSLLNIGGLSRAQPHR